MLQAHVADPTDFERLAFLRRGAAAGLLRLVIPADVSTVVVCDIFCHIIPMSSLLPWVICTTHSNLPATSCSGIRAGALATRWQMRVVGRDRRQCRVVV